MNEIMNLENKVTGMDRVKGAVPGVIIATGGAFYKDIKQKYFDPMPEIQKEKYVNGAKIVGVGFVSAFIAYLFTNAPKNYDVAVDKS